MRGHGRPWQTLQKLTLAVASFLSFQFVAATAWASNGLATEKLPIAWQDDAELTDVCFLNATVGWAVGAQGVILRTTDAGKTWQRSIAVEGALAGRGVNESTREVPLSEKLRKMRQGPETRLVRHDVRADASRRDVRIRFDSVHFVDSLHGWAAGGYEVPWLNRSRGFVVRTVDGGKTWHPTKGLTIPRVQKIQFTSRQTGWAIGGTNALHPTGIFFTHDGGVSWSSGSAKPMARWLDGQPMGGQFALIDESGRLATVVGGTMKRPSLFGFQRDDRLVCLASLDEQTAYAAGPNGMVVKTTDGGVSWKRLKFNQNVNLGDRLTSAIAVDEQTLWLAPTSGGLIRVDLNDNVVRRVSLPSSLPVRRIQFVDARHGFAVGELGTILSTDDGGENWRRLRGDHDRLAMLLVAKRPTEIALDLLAMNAGEESRLCGTFVLDPDTSPSASVQAFERVGSAVNWRASTNQASHQQAELVAAIRTLKPLVVVCCHDLRSAGQYQNAMALTQMITIAIEQAASDDQPDLRPGAWQVERLVTSDLAGEVRVDSRRMLPSMGMAVADQVALSRAVLGQPTRGAKASTWRVTHPGPGRPMQGSDLLYGLGRANHSVPTRKRRTALGNLNRMNQALAQQKLTEQLVSLDVTTDQELAAWRQKLLPFAMAMDQNLAGLWLLDLADQYLAAGRFRMTDQTLELLTTYWPDHAIAPAANAWLTVTRAQVVLPDSPAKRPLDPFMRLTQADPALVMEPGYQWLELNLLAKKSGLRSVQPKLAQLARTPATDAADLGFAIAARQELASLELSADRDATATAPHASNMMACVYARQRPQLDGRLDDSIWRDLQNEKKLTAFELIEAEQEHDRVYFAYDEQFFYGAYQCQKLNSQPYPFRRSARPRDPDLSRRDRVELTLDSSLSFCGGVSLTVDHRGWVAESKLGAKGWNPAWYVAQAEDETSWTVEFAIPLTAIAPADALPPSQPTHQTDPLARGWAIAISRLGDRSQLVWEGTQAATKAVGMQASLQPEPAKFRRLIFQPRNKSVAQEADTKVRQVQFELESKDSMQKFRQPPQVPEFHAP